MAAKEKEKSGGFLRGCLIDIVIAVAIAAVILVFIKPTIVVGPSMMPRFFDGDYLIVYKMAYHSKEPHKGDVVVFRTEDPEEGGQKLLIKRVIGVPGDVIDIKKGQVYINGEKDDQGYTRDGNTSGKVKGHKVPEGSVYCLGDNRNDSMDSRELGDISEDQVVGKVVLRLYPFDRFGWIHDPYKR